MKKLAGVALVLALCASAADAQQSKSKGGSSTAARRTPASVATVLPADAVKIQDGVYKAKDASGKIWIYARTPFGYTKSDEATFKEALRASEVPSMRVAAIEGEKVKFERDSPFGKSVWSKAVPDLTPEERSALEAYQAKLKAKNEK